MAVNYGIPTIPHERENLFKSGSSPERKQWVRWLVRVARSTPYEIGTALQKSVLEAPFGGIPSDEVKKAMAALVGRAGSLGISSSSFRASSISQATIALELVRDAIKASRGEGSESVGVVETASDDKVSKAKAKLAEIRAAAEVQRLELATQREALQLEQAMEREAAQHEAMMAAGVESPGLPVGAIGSPGYGPAFGNMAGFLPTERQLDAVTRQGVRVMGAHYNGLLVETDILDLDLTGQGAGTPLNLALWQQAQNLAIKPIYETLVAAQAPSAGTWKTDAATPIAAVEAATANMQDSVFVGSFTSGHIIEFECEVTVGDTIVLCAGPNLTSLGATTSTSSKAGFDTFTTLGGATDAWDYETNLIGTGVPFDYKPEILRVKGRANDTQVILIAVNHTSPFDILIDMSKAANSIVRGSKVQSLEHAKAKGIATGLYNTPIFAHTVGF
jgi:hypothetical protein